MMNLQRSAPHSRTLINFLAFDGCPSLAFFRSFRLLAQMGRMPVFHFAFSDASILFFIASELHFAFSLAILHSEVNCAISNNG